MKWSRDERHQNTKAHLSGLDFFAGNHSVIDRRIAQARRSTGIVTIERCVAEAETNQKENQPENSPVTDLSKDVGGVIADRSINNNRLVHVAPSAECLPVGTINR